MLYKLQRILDDYFSIRFGPMPGRGRRCYCGPSYPYDSTVRTRFHDKGADIFAWPSRGGVIVLDDAEAIDFEFVGLNPLCPLTRRLEDPADEDAFCQRLLLLGAKWWDSEARYSLVAAMAVPERPEDQRVNSAFYLKDQPPPTRREKRDVRVGWPSSGGGVWVGEWDWTWAGIDDEEEHLLPPDDVSLGKLRMARTMDERCMLLRDRFQAAFYSNVEDYQGYAFLNSWAAKTTGEVGALLQPQETATLYWDAYYNWGSSKEYRDEK